jgi:hypothetical protein
MNDISLKVVMWPEVKGHPKAPPREGYVSFEYHEIEELALHFDLMIQERDGDTFLFLCGKGRAFKQR